MRMETNISQKLSNLIDDKVTVYRPDYKPHSYTLMNIINKAHNSVLCPSWNHILQLKSLDFLAHWWPLSRLHLYKGEDASTKSGLFTASNYTQSTYAGVVTANANTILRISTLNYMAI